MTHRSKVEHRADQRKSADAIKLVQSVQAESSGKMRYIDPASTKTESSAATDKRLTDCSFVQVVCVCVRACVLFTCTPQLDGDPYFDDRAFNAAGPRVWNYIFQFPTELRQPDLPNSHFRQLADSFLFDQSVGSKRHVNPRLTALLKSYLLYSFCIRLLTDFFDIHFCSLFLGFQLHFYLIKILSLTLIYPRRSFRQSN